MKTKSSIFDVFEISGISFRLLQSPYRDGVDGNGEPLHIYVAAAEWMDGCDVVLAWDMCPEAVEAEEAGSPWEDEERICNWDAPYILIA